MSVTINGTSGLVFNDASTQNTAATGFGFKNRLINGNMTISQRNGTSTVTPADTAYTLDRWQSRNDGKFSVAQSTVAPAGFTNSLLVTSLSSYSVGSTDFYTQAQQIEGFNISDLAWGTASASPVTLSFWVRSSLTGTFGGALRNSANNRSYVFSYSISSANTWTNVSVTITGDTTGTWLTDNGVGIRVEFGLGVGSSNSGTAGSWGANANRSVTGAVSVVGTNGATWQVTGVQLEKGSTATSFDYRPYGTEFALCQRYYQKYGRLDILLNTSNASSRRLYVPRTVTMRATPTETGTQGAGGSINFYGSASNTGIDVDSATAGSGSEVQNYTASAEL